MDTISLSERACADVVLGLLLFLVVSSIRQQPTFCIRITFHHGNILVLFIEFAVGKLDVKQRVLEGNDLLSPLAVQGDGNLGHSIFSSSVSRG